VKQNARSDSEAGENRETPSVVNALVEHDGEVGTGARRSRKVQHRNGEKLR
jgi:hypothetical protein